MKLTEIINFFNYSKDVDNFTSENSDRSLKENSQHPDPMNIAGNGMRCLLRGALISGTAATTYILTTEISNKNMIIALAYTTAGAVLDGMQYCWRGSRQIGKIYAQDELQNKSRR